MKPSSSSLLFDIGTSISIPNKGERMSKKVKKAKKVAKFSTQIKIRKGVNIAELIWCLRIIVELLNKEKRLSKNKVFIFLSSAMDARLKKFGITNVADFMLMLQDTGLASFYKEKRGNVWRVVRIKRFDDFAHYETVNRALSMAEGRRRKYARDAALRAENRSLKERNSKLIKLNPVRDIRSA